MYLYRIYGRIFPVKDYSLMVEIAREVRRRRTRYNLNLQEMDLTGEGSSILLNDIDLKNYFY